MTGIKQVVKRSIFSEFLGLWGTFSYIIRGVNYLSTKTRHIYGTHENCYIGLQVNDLSLLVTNEDTKLALTYICEFESCFFSKNFFKNILA